MTIAVAERVFLDTSVLLTATAPQRRNHHQARIVLEAWPNRGVQLCASGQVMREYLVVATRPLAANGLGLSVANACRNVQGILDRLRYLDETSAVSRRLVALLAGHRISGKRIHDANIVAAALAHGIETLVTDDREQFGGLGEIQVLELGAIAPEDPGA